MLGNRPQKIKFQNDPTGQVYVEGFAGGLNTLVSPQHIANNECSILLNAAISEDGVITRRSGSTYYDSAADGTRVRGLFPFTTYDSSGVATRMLLKVDNSGNLKKYNNGSWTTITGYTYTAGKNTEFAQSATYAYTANGVDPLTKTDGSTITTFTQVATPAISTLALSTAGTAGTTSYSYTYTLVTNTGETKPADTSGSLPNYKTITTGNATLSTSNYNVITITRSTDANVIGYNIYGRQAGQLFYLAYVPQTSSGDIVYNDQGTATPNSFFGLPTQNGTAGIIGSIILTYHDTLMIGGVTSDPSRVYYSAGLDLFDNFQIVNGGGSVVVNRSDGDTVTGMVVFKDKVMIFKSRSSYVFSFGSAGQLPTVTVVNPEIGCVAPRSVRVVVNDVFFLGAGGTGVFTLGYQQGYYGAGGVADLLRTNEVSIKVHPTFSTINKTYMQNAAAIHSAQQYTYILAYPSGGSTYNDAIMVYDTRYSAWVQWDSLKANCFCLYIDSSGNERVLYGDDNQGRINELYNGTSDNGNTFTFRMRTKDFNAQAFHLIKTWIWPTFHFRNILGGMTVSVITDGATNSSTVNISSTTSYTGWSYDRWANFRWGTTAGSSASATSADAPRQKTLRIDARSIMFLFENTSANDSFSILGVECRYITRTGRRLPGEYLIS